MHNFSAKNIAATNFVSTVKLNESETKNFENDKLAIV